MTTKKKYLIFAFFLAIFLIAYNSYREGEISLKIVIISIISGLVGGLVAYLFQKLGDDFKQKK